ncbi:hypothetical protein L1987_68898 [Smallanthus sonchifolius]|uniref:Uncharacterized protein n=1 Tax=Smallanthus sonchifolius TaxID=185202 RepID=A0ACB9B539_9ASTR|nr:hypothetical protein L1987_68898 [Smallanthus sonchifolius]
MEDNDTDSLIIKNLDAKQKHDQDTLSAEDFAWADSCLIEDPEISETNMDSLKEALLHILDQHTEILGASADEQGNSNDKIDPKNSHLVIEEVTSHTAEKSVDQDLEQESHDAISILKKQPFLPNFNDDMMNIQYSDDDDDAGFVLSQFVTEPRSDEDIFKVWDLDIPVEEDELGKQLKEALSSDADKTRAPKKKGLKMESLDSLVESIADLSIK